MEVAGSEYDAASDMNRALMESQLLSTRLWSGSTGSTDSI